MNASTPHTRANALPDALHRLLDRELSLAARLGYVVLLLLASTMTAVVASLWLTEPALPLRTQIAFAAMTVAGLSWCAFAAWALRHRRVLFARHGVIAGRLATTFTAVFALGAFVWGWQRGGAVLYVATLLGLALFGVAAALLVRAHRRHARLLEQRRVLERELGLEG